MEKIHLESNAGYLLLFHFVIISLFCIILGICSTLTFAAIFFKGLSLSIGLFGILGALAGIIYFSLDAKRLAREYEKATEREYEETAENNCCQG